MARFSLIDLLPLMLLLSLSVLTTLLGLFLGMAGFLSTSRTETLQGPVLRVTPQSYRPLDVPLTVPVRQREAGPAMI